MVGFSSRRGAPRRSRSPTGSSPSRRPSASRSRTSGPREPTPRSCPTAVARALEALGIADGPSYTQLRIGPGGPTRDRSGSAPRRRPRRRTGRGRDRGRPERPRHRGRARDGACAKLAQTPGRRRGHALPDRPGRSARGSRGPRGARRASSASGSTASRATNSAPLRRGSDRAGAVLAVGDSRSQALAHADAAADRIRFRTANARALV